MAKIFGFDGGVGACCTATDDTDIDIDGVLRRYGSVPVYERCGRGAGEGKRCKAKEGFERERHGDCGHFSYETG